MGLFDYTRTILAETYYYQDANEQQSEPGARKRELYKWHMLITSNSSFDNDTLLAETYYYQDANEQQSEPGARKRELTPIINWDYLTFDPSCKILHVSGWLNDRQCNIPTSLWAEEDSMHNYDLDTSAAGLCQNPQLGIL